MTPEQLAALHAQCFTTPRPWTKAEFAELLRSTGVFLVAMPTGFALGRTAGPEAELLTLAVSPKARRAGTGRALLAEFEAIAKSKKADEAILEVAASNIAAKALYANAGYSEAGRRVSYYHTPEDGPVDALILRKPLF